MDKTLDKVIKRHIVLTCLTGFAIVLMIVAITYGLYQMHHPNTTDQEISIGDFDVNITSSSGQVTLSNLYPGTENNTTYTFTTSNSGDYTVKYEVYFTNNTSIFLATGNNATTYAAYTSITSENYQYILYKLDNGEYKPLSEVYDSTTEKFTILSGRLQPNDSFTHTVKFMVASDAPNSIQGSILALNITMTATAATEVGTDTIIKMVSGSPTNSTNVITKTAPANSGGCTNTFAYDGTSDNSLRYVGSNPCNYVNFNNENDGNGGWRIVGVMNNVDDGTGKKETRLKLIRKSSIGTNRMDENNHNNWPDSTLNATLQTYYENLDTNSKDLVGSAVYYLGAIFSSDYSSNENGNPLKMYLAERGTTVWGSTSGQNCNDAYCPRATSAISNVAIPYASDAGFSMGGTDEKRTSCLAIALKNFNTDYCYEYAWALKPSWAFPPENTPNRGYAFNTRILDVFTVNYNKDVRPVLYLKSDVKITGGTGTTGNPYTLG